MKVFVGCEKSQVVCKAFRKLGHEAYSCDIDPCKGGHPEWHLQEDVMRVLSNGSGWDIIILHPDCSTLATSGNRWYAKGMPLYGERLKQIEWAVRLWSLATKKGKMVALENPESVIFNKLPGKPFVQFIQPWQFGHGEQKKTGLALRGLPPLVPTKIVDGREQKILAMSPSDDRKELRSITYQGIADAMAAQWGMDLKERRGWFYGYCKAK